jgi:ribosome-binding protein aMBF1 (putative translation factor)
MSLSSKTFLSAAVLIVGAVGAGLFLRAPSERDAANVAQVASSGPAQQSDAARTARILEQQLAYTTDEVARAESQRAASQELVRDVTERLRIAQTDSGAPVQALEEQLANATAAVARLESELVVSRGRARELGERLRLARAAAGL